MNCLIKQQPIYALNFSCNVRAISYQTFETGANQIELFTPSNKLTHISFALNQNIFGQNIQTLPPKVSKTFFFLEVEVVI